MLTPRSIINATSQHNGFPISHLVDIHDILEAIFHALEQRHHPLDIAILLSVIQTLRREE